MGEHDQANEAAGPAPVSAEPAVRGAGAPGPQTLAGVVGNRAFSAVVARQASGGGGGILPGGTVHPDVAAAIAARRGGGSPLSPRVREEMGSALGDDLGDVRVHTDAGADDLTRSVEARAFTLGTDVYFAEGEFSHGSTDGRRLLAHELSHVTQQRGAPEGGSLTVSEPGDAMERDADAAAEAVMGRSPADAAPDLVEARTPEERAKGLSGADRVPRDGMAFRYDGAVQHPFHMEGVDVPLDLVTVDGTGTVQEVQPMSPTEGPGTGPAFHQPSAPFTDAIEVAQGTASDLGLAPGRRVARSADGVLARGPLDGLKAAATQTKGKVSAAFTKQLGDRAKGQAAEMWDNIGGVTQAPSAAAQAAQALAAGQNGVAPASLPSKAVSQEDQDKLKQIIQFELINAYLDRLLAQHPELATDATDATPAAAQPQQPPAPDQPPSPAPTAAPAVDDVNRAILDSVALAVQLKIESMWKRGVWPEGHEYVWGEDDTHGGSEWIGVTGALTFTSLAGQAITVTPALGESAKKLGIADMLASPGPLSVRMIVGGNLVRGATWSNSLFDNLAVNCQAQTPTSNGPGGSVAIQVNTNWLWDDNQTVWDFIVTVADDGTPVVEDRHDGKPKDSAWLAWWQGQGGTHSTLTPQATLDEQKKAAAAPNPAGGGGARPVPTGLPTPTGTPDDQDKRPSGGKLGLKRRDEAVLARAAERPGVRSSSARGGRRHSARSPPTRSWPRRGTAPRPSPGASRPPLGRRRPARP